LAYKILFLEQTLKELSSFDKKSIERILYKVSTHLVKSPAKLGKRLKGDYAGFFKYRVGDWRVIYHLDEENKTITITKIGHRREVYK
jgi:mRNA interferase RelE/StbE